MAKLFTLYACPIPAVVETIRRENAQLPDLLALHRAVADGKVTRDSLTRPTILGKYHDSPAAGHPGERCTLARISAVFYSQGLRQDIHDYKFVSFILATMDLPSSFNCSDPFDTPICACLSTVREEEPSLDSGAREEEPTIVREEEPMVDGRPSPNREKAEEPNTKPTSRLRPGRSRPSQGMNVQGATHRGPASTMILCQDN
ncbi:hypothetical protein SASPL_132933 [Salvia splendens]|uniref:Integrase zinc-binding domain-containing protein n=1 Tax=Salvia splendens TaxID=180675 RepID=A0A8X8ZIM2_SALSN|nr:hypothetical protein SASPL_132933 [Salvia splendens]